MRITQENITDLGVDGSDIPELRPYNNSTDLGLYGSSAELRPYNSSTDLSFILTLVEE